MLHTRLFLFLLGVSLALVSCRSFDEKIKGVIALDEVEYADSSGAKGVFMIGLKPFSQADPARLVVDPWRIITDKFPDSIHLYVRIFDRDGYLITNLAPPYYDGTGDYRAIWNGLTEQIGTDGQPEKIENFTVREFSENDGLPNELALVLDYSGTMGSSIELLENAAQTFVKLKRPADRISVVKFDDKPQLAAKASTQTDELLALFGSGLKGFGNYTAIYSAAKLGGEQIAAAPAENPRAMILFTDGEDNASKINELDLYAFVKKHNIPIFTVAFGAVNRGLLQELSKYSGGKFYQTEDPKKLPAIFEDIYRSLRNYYLISYQPVNAGGRHIARVGLNPPGAPEQIAGKIEYETSGPRLSPNTIAGNNSSEQPIERQIQFAYNSADLLPESNPALDTIAARMKRNPRLEIKIEGHASAEGTPERNQLLSEQRAESVRQALIQRGIAERRLTSQGYGSTMPLQSNESEEGRKLNRRVAIVVTRR
ncbi:MAG: OmpA family protein [Chlorobi bacterium]|nr:OmpA family protein [Chlorobiota bacterium]